MNRRITSFLSFFFFLGFDKKSGNISNERGNFRHRSTDNHTKDSKIFNWSNEEISLNTDEPGCSNRRQCRRAQMPR